MTPSCEDQQQTVLAEYALPSRRNGTQDCLFVAVVCPEERAVNAALRHCIVPLNVVPGSRFTRSRESEMDEFMRCLDARGISTTMRDTRGSDIDAVCGQSAAGEKE